VDVRGLVTPRFNGWSLDVWMREGDKLFSPSTDPKDLQYLQKEREQHNNMMKNNEDEIIKLMINVDGVEIKKNSVLDQIKEIEKDYKIVSEERLKRKEEYTKRIEELKIERKTKRCPKCNKIVRMRVRCKTCHKKLR